MPTKEEEEAFESSINHNVLLNEYDKRLVRMGYMLRSQQIIDKKEEPAIVRAKHRWKLEGYNEPEFPMGPTR